MGPTQGVCRQECEGKEPPRVEYGYLHSTDEYLHNTVEYLQSTDEYLHNTVEYLHNTDATQNC